MTAAAIRAREGIAAARQPLEIPASPAVLAGLAAHYHNPVLGDVRIVRTPRGTDLAIRTIRAPLATRTNADGTVTLVGLSPGWSPELLVGTREGRKTLTMRAGQHAYVFDAIN